MEQLRGALRAPGWMAEVVATDRMLAKAHITDAMFRLVKFWTSSVPVQQPRIARVLVEKGIVSPRAIEVRLRANGIEDLALELRPSVPQEVAARVTRIKKTGERKSSLPAMAADHLRPYPDQTAQWADARNPSWWRARGNTTAEPTPLQLALAPRTPLARYDRVRRAKVPAGVCPEGGGGQQLREPNGQSDDPGPGHRGGCPDPPAGRDAV